MIDKLNTAGLPQKHSVSNDYRLNLQYLCSLSSHIATNLSQQYTYVNSKTADGQRVQH